jgi:polyphosphate glucokinase
VKAKKTSKTILTVDVGGTHVKLMTNLKQTKLEFASGPDLSAAAMVRKVKTLAKDLSYDVVSIGYPGVVSNNRIVKEPVNLGKGWKDFDFEKAFGCPTKVVNDALMQALGSYERGRMLFLGLGTGLGSAMILDDVLVPMELGHLPYRKKTFEDYVGTAGLKRLGMKKWRRRVVDVVTDLSAALQPEYIVLGGGNAGHVDELPPKTRRGDNNNAFIGGFRLWDST